MKAIRRSDSPWGDAPRAPSAPVAVRRDGDGGGWLAGPAWLYVAAAVAVFAAAVIVAVVRAGGDSGAAAPDPQPVTAVVQPDPTQQASPSESDQPQQQSAAQTGQTAQTAQTEQAAQTAQVAQVQPPNQNNRFPSPAGDSDITADGDDTQAVQPQQQTQAQSQTATTDDHPLRGFIVPIAGACATDFEGHLPSAPRSYRAEGIHEGYDFYEWASCTEVGYHTPILAAKGGVVIRADLDYVDVTAADWARFEAAGWEGEAILDQLRGRQVWIDHGRGIVTRYAHLHAIAAGVDVGAAVEGGQVIGFPGESGQRESYAAPGTDIHLHFEIRVGDGYLGQGLPPQEARLLYLEAWGLNGG